uniref:Cytochrome P450 n=1 Tax=Panagrolaimus sp. ES5 TaxID=591445 RepID=A0AC34FN43_9BILA
MLFYVASSIFLFLFYHLYWKRRNFPAGPIPLPFIGNVHQFYYYGFEEAIKKFHNTYGDLHTIWFGDTPVVSVNDFPTIVEKFVKNGDSVSGREESTLFLEVTKNGPYGITFIDGPLWKEQRKFGLKTLRDLGMGKDVMQEKVLHEVSCLLDEVKDNLKCNNNVISMQNLIDQAVGSVINSIVLGYRFDKENESDFYKLKHHIETVFHLYGHPLWKILENSPKFYRYLPFFNPVYKNMKNACDSMREFLESQIQKHRNEINLDGKNMGEPKDYVEAFLQQQYKMKQEEITDHYYTDEQLYGAVWDLWSAGQETTSTTLAWLVYYVTYFADAQSKIHEELDKVIGSDRLVTMNDKPNLPYINAVVNESQRRGNIGPINLFHRTLEDIEIRGHKIRKNITIVDNFATVMMDKRYFDNPDKFDPSRFIDENGKFVTKPEVFPFGIGKRACLGEGLARMELFLFTANIFNQLKLTQNPTKSLSTKRIEGGTILPETYLATFKSAFLELEQF